MSESQDKILIQRAKSFLPQQIRAHIFGISSFKKTLDSNSSQKQKFEAKINNDKRRNS
jgi:hypothetical protein